MVYEKKKDEGTENNIDKNINSLVHAHTHTHTHLRILRIREKIIYCAPSWFSSASKPRVILLKSNASPI